MAHIPTSFRILVALVAVSVGDTPFDTDDMLVRVAMRGSVVLGGVQIERDSLLAPAEACSSLATHAPGLLVEASAPFVGLNGMGEGFLRGGKVLLIEIYLA